MTLPVPARPKIYHIVHVDNLASIVADGCLWSDAVMAQRRGATVIGMNSIKERRLGLPISCHDKLTVGECVPVYFCPRSVMLYVIHRADHPELAYRGGQQPIVHLEVDLRLAIKWAQATSSRWALSTSNAATRYTPFFAQEEHLAEVNWPAVAADSWSAPDVKEAKQAEFLIERSFPWH